MDKGFPGASIDDPRSHIYHSACRQLRFETKKSTSCTPNWRSHPETVIVRSSRNYAARSYWLLIPMSRISLLHFCTFALAAAVASFGELPTTSNPEVVNVFFTS